MHMPNKIAVKCAHTRMMALSKLVPNPRNPNTHPEAQIELLAKIIESAGWRHPIVVSKRSGFITKGEGRYLAAQLLKVRSVPVDEQAYATEAEEWADMIADNRLAELSEIDRGTLKDLIAELDTGEFDLDLTGFEQDDLALLMSELGSGAGGAGGELGGSALEGDSVLKVSFGDDEYPLVLEGLRGIHDDQRMAILQLLDIEPSG